MNRQQFTCLYCNKLLSKKPLKKTTCPYCGGFMYVRTLLNSSQKVVTEIEAKRLDQLKRISEFGVSEADYQRHEEILNKRFGKVPDYHDVIWSLYNELISKNTDFHTLNMIYYQMAWFLKGEGKPFNHMLRLKHKMDLLRYKNEDSFIKKVDIDASACCEKCKKLNGKVYTIEAALKEEPLPSKDCDDFCMCVYLPLID